jgi:hypothetical protein
MLTGDSPFFIEVKLSLSFDTVKSTARLKLLSSSLKESDLILKFPRLAGSVAEGITGGTGTDAITILYEKKKNLKTAHSGCTLYETCLLRRY